MSNARNLARVIVDSSGDIAANNLDNAVPADGSITAAKLAASLDLSSKTLTYPDNSVQSADIASLAAAKVSGQLADSNMASGSVLQVATATKTAKQLLSGNANTMLEYDTGFRVSLTPLASNTKLLLFMHISGGTTTGCPRFRFEYSTNGGGSWSPCAPVGDVDGSRCQSHCSIPINGDANVMAGTSAEILWQHNTTSNIIIRVVMGGDVGGTWLMWNGSINNPNNFLGNTMTSTLRAMEIAA
jgi:hypothetical protein